MSLLSFLQPTPVAGLPLSQLLDSLSDVVLLLDDALHLRYCNACWQQVSGIPVAEALDTPFIQYLHPEDHNRWIASVEAVQQDGHCELIWLRLIHRDNDLRWCELRIQPLKQGNQRLLSATLCDITVQVRNDEISKASHRSLSGLVDRLPGMLYRGRNDTNWTMEYVSEGCQALTGYNREQLLNQPRLSIGLLIHPEDSERVWDTVQLALQRNQCFELRYRLLHADGQYRNVYEKGQGIRSSGGAVLSIEGIILPANLDPAQQAYPF